MARKSNRLTARNVFYIITNGEQTEYNYFKLLKEKHSVYDIKIIFENADPLGLVQYAQRYIATANQVWCVFDIDYTYKEKRLLPALKQAEDSGIKIAYSNVSFEVWLISHFEKCKTTLQLSDYFNELNKLLKESGSKKLYSKTDEKLLKDFLFLTIRKLWKIQKLYIKIMLKHIMKSTQINDNKYGIGFQVQQFINWSNHLN